MSQNIVPTGMRDLRACMLCSLVKTTEQFRQHGCENCEEFLQLTGDVHKIEECTSKNFEGLIALMQPDSSWVSNWQRINKFNKGVYAISVAGQLPDAVIDELQQQGIPYRSRDNSQR